MWEASEINDNRKQEECDCRWTGQLEDGASVVFPHGQ